MLKEACTGDEADKVAGKPCALKLCKEVEQCSSVKEDQPPGVFLAFSSYYFTHAFFKLGPFFSLKNLQKEVKRYKNLEREGKRYCDIEWNTLSLLAKYVDVKEKYLKRYCFNAAYIVTLLNSAYGFPMDTQQIVIANTLHGNEISWTLGAMIDIAMGSQIFLKRN